MKKRNHLRSYIKKVISDANSAKLKKNVDMFRYCEYNSEISEKFYKFLDLCLKMPFEIQTENGRDVRYEIALIEKNSE